MGPGDDCAVLDDGLVVSVDLTIEGTHFKRDWIALEEAGFRAMAAALSDLAAMAALPVGALLSIAVRPNEVRSAAPRIRAGAAEACRLAGIELIGGDLARSPGPLVMDVIVLGRTRNPVLRAGALPGDDVWVTGSLGGSAAAVELWNRGGTPPAELRTLFARPRPRLREARWLAECVPLHALIDLSDGLAGDAGHLAAASGVSLVLEVEAVPVQPGLSEVPELSRESGLRLALSGGEDYELCFCAPSGAVESWAERFQQTFGIGVTRVGRVKEGPAEVLMQSGGRTLALEAGGFSHFPMESVE